MAFALSTFDRWSRRRRPHELAWTIALLLFAIGSAALWWAMERGWSAPSFRVFFLSGAILNVPWLALGTVYLLGGERCGHRCGRGCSGSPVSATGVMLVAPLKGPCRRTSSPRAASCSVPFPRVLAAVGSGVSAVVIIGGALWSAWRVSSALAALATSVESLGNS